MGRFIAVDCDDDVARIHDSETGDWADVEFHGKSASEMAWACAHQWNIMIERRDEEFEEWYKLEAPLFSLAKLGIRDLVNDPCRCGHYEPGVDQLCRWCQS
jgi:hypothetical protein